LRKKTDVAALKVQFLSTPYIFFPCIHIVISYCVFQPSGRQNIITKMHQEWLQVLWYYLSCSNSL